MGGLPSGLVMFVFTDIEGSTRLFQTLGDRYQQVLADHNDRLRAAFSAHGGHEINTTGDGFFVAFGEADAAAAACLEGQRSLRELRGPDAIELRVRMGIHAAESQPIDGDYVSVDAHKAARIMTAAHGGQVLLSDAAAQAVSELPSDTGVESLGVFRLRDFVEPIELYQLTHPDLLMDFPPVRATPVTAHNVAPLRERLVGRDGDLAALRDAEAKARLVSIVGPGGVGKTSVAAELVRESALDFPDGAWLVDLAPLADSGAVAETVAAALGVGESPGRSALDSLIGWLRTRRLLVVIDNCEHLVDACASLVKAILERTEKVQVVVTSREPLGVAGERVYRLEPLVVPDVEATDEAMVEAPAVRLFLDRVAEARPGFEPDSGDVEAVAALCRSVDGLPLAIELAAAHVRALSPREVHGQLLRGAVLRSAARDAPPRHRSLTDVIDWSYRLLDEEERTVFRGCAVFAGEFSLEAAEEVLTDSTPPHEIVSRLYSLYNKSLLQRRDGSSGTRFRMLEPVKQRGDQLLSAAERSALANRHAAWAVRMVKEAQHGLRSNAQGAWLNRLDEERANLVAALAWLRDTGDRHRLAVLATGLGPYWFIRGSKHEGLHWLTEVIDSEPDEPVLIAALSEAAKLALQLGSSDMSEELANRAVAIADQAGMPIAAADAAVTLAFVAHNHGDRPGARRWIDKALQLSRDGNDLHQVIVSLISRAQFELESGDTHVSSTQVAEAVRLAERDGTPRLRMRALGLSGELAFDESRFDDALATSRQALTLARELGDRSLTCWYLIDVARAFTQLDDHREATGHLEAALRISRHESDHLVEAQVRRAQAELARYRGDAQEAVTHALEGLAIALQSGQRGGHDEHLAALAEGLVLAGHYERAAIVFGAAAGAREAGTDLPPIDRRQLEAAETQARAVLGTRFDDLFAAGTQASDDDSLRALLRREQAAEVAHELRRDID